MKKNHILWSLIVAAMAIVCSCSSNSKSSDLLNLVPADMEYVMVINPRAIVESAGGSLTDNELKLPEWVEELDSYNQEDLEEAADKLKAMGINTEGLVIAGSVTKNYYVVIASISDKDKLVKFVKDEMEFDNESEDDDIVIYTRDGNKCDCVAISGSHAYLYDGSYGSNCKRGIRTFIEDAKEASFGDSPVASYVASGNAFGFSVKLSKSMTKDLKEEFALSSASAKALNGYYCGKCSLSENKIAGEVKFFDEDGNAKDMKEFDNMLDMKAKISKDALAYLGKNESVVAASSLKDVNWDEYLEMVAATAGMSRSDKMAMNAVGDYLKNIDGTVAVGFGLTNGMESIGNLSRQRDIMQQIDVTIVIETKDGKAAKLMSDLGDLLASTGIPYSGNAAKGFSVNFEGMEFYAAAKGNCLIASNHKIEKNNANPTVKAFNFTDYIAALALALDKNNQMIKDLGIHADILLSYGFDANNAAVVGELEIKGGKGKGVLEKIAYMCIEISQKDLSSYFPSYYNYDEYYSDADYDEFYDWVDEVEVAEYEEW